MEFQVYELNGYMELDGKEFIEDNLQTISALGGREAYIFPENKLNDLAEAVGAEKEEDFVSRDEIIDKQLLKYVGITANKRDIIDILQRSTGRYYHYSMGIVATREAFSQAVEEGTITKEHVYDIIADAGNITLYRDAIKDMIKKKVDFPISNSSGEFFRASPPDRHATMRIIDINDSNIITFITNTPVFSTDRVTLLENPRIKYTGGIVADRSGRAKEINIRERLPKHPDFNLAFNVYNIIDAVNSHIISMNTDKMSNVSPVLRSIIALYV